MNKEDKIYIAGHNGLVGSALWRGFKQKGYTNLIGFRSRELNLIDQAAVNQFFSDVQPDYVVLAAAKVGGIQANNTYRAQFIYENLMMQANVIHAAYEHKVKKLLFLGSSCIYPKVTEQPISEEALLSGTLEPTNEPYAVAKIAGLRMCDAYNRQYGTNFISAMPTNLYGPGDNYHPENSHVLPAMIRRFHEAKEQGLDEVTCWGSGQPLREFLFSEDLSSAVIYLLENISYTDLAHVDPSGTVHSHINIGSGTELSIKKLAETIAEVVGFQGRIHWDTSKPDGTQRKKLNSSRLKELGWNPQWNLYAGLEVTYQDYKNALTARS